MVPHSSKQLKAYNVHRMGTTWLFSHLVQLWHVFIDVFRMSAGFLLRCWDCHRLITSFPFRLNADHIAALQPARIRSLSQLAAPEILGAIDYSRVV